MILAEKCSWWLFLSVYSFFSRIICNFAPCMKTTVFLHAFSVQPYGAFRRKLAHGADRTKSADGSDRAYPADGALSRPSVAGRDASLGSPRRVCRRAGCPPPVERLLRQRLVEARLRHRHNRPPAPRPEARRPLRRCRLEPVGRCARLERTDAFYCFKVDGL